MPENTPVVVLKLTCAGKVDGVAPLGTLVTDGAEKVGAGLKLDHATVKVLPPDLSIVNVVCELSIDAVGIAPETSGWG